MQTKQQIRQLLADAGVKPNKRLGQHFLIDLNLIRLLVDTAEIGPGDVVLEVGGGTGSLTEAIAERAGAVISVEIDPTLARIAGSALEHCPNVQLINTDALANKNTVHSQVVEAISKALTRAAGVRTEYPASGIQHPASSPGRLLLVANLPYQVASPLMINLITGTVIVDAMYVTVQKEVADRMTAEAGTGDYGLLSVLLASTGSVRTLRTLRPSVFWPAPQVDSAMVAFVRDPQKAGRIGEMGLFTEVLGLFLGHRRKMLKSAARLAQNRLGAVTDWPAIFEACGVDPRLRPDRLACEGYIALANACREHLAAR
ncbi:MAG TPA: ribosomal RNA small subunit methyltransferase A [Phycisphaerales bacterium]|nr:ribosomal RNA small subunit methyltransferase A [Phycisphaerales bacterium]